MWIIMPDAPLPCQGTLTGRAAIRAFITYLPAYEQGQRKKGNPESRFQRETQDL
jgi:hypothetical protein